MDSGLMFYSPILFQTHITSALAFEREHAERLCEDDIADDTSSVTSSTAELTAPAAAEPQPSSPASTNPPSSPPIAEPPQSPCMLSLPSSHFPTYYQAESVDVDLLTEEIEASIEGVEKRVVSDIKLCFSYIIDMLHHVPSVREYCIQKGFAHSTRKAESTLPRKWTPLTWTWDCLRVTDHRLHRQSLMLTPRPQRTPQTPYPPLPCPQTRPL